MSDLLHSKAVSFTIKKANFIPDNCTNREHFGVLNIRTSIILFTPIFIIGYFQLDSLWTP
jgi:hypothetical protein